MTNVIQTQTIDTGILDIARSAFVSGVASTGELLENYALTMCKVFNVMDITGTKVIKPWYKLEGKEAKGIKAERARFMNDMMDSKPKFIKEIKPDGTRVHTATLDTYWQRVKIESGYVPSGKVKGGTDVDAKTAAELKTMINRILTAEEEGKDVHASMILQSLKTAYFVLVGEEHDADK
jgi:hypothetical protein